MSGTTLERRRRVPRGRGVQGEQDHIVQRRTVIVLKCRQDTWLLGRWGPASSRLPEMQQDLGRCWDLGPQGC